MSSDNSLNEEFELDNITIFGGSSKTGRIYIFGDGNDSDIGEALAGILKWSREGKSDQQIFFRKIFVYFLKRVCELFGISLENSQRDAVFKIIRSEKEAEELLARWEEEDRVRKEKKEEKTYH